MRVVGSLILPMLFTMIVLFFLTPLIVVAGVSFTSASFIQFPPTEPSLRWYVSVLTSSDWLGAFAASSLIAGFVAIVTSMGSAMAVLTLKRDKTSKALRNFLTLLCGIPLLLPHVSLGIAFLAGSNALALPPSYMTIAFAHCILALPFAYRPILSSYDNIDPAMQEAATTLGATPQFAFWQVLLPALRPGIVVATIFTFVTSFDDVTVALFLVGPGITTLPVRVLAEAQETASPAIAAASTIMIVFTIGSLALMERVFGLSVFVPSDRSK